MYIVLDRLDSADDVRIHEIMNELARMVGKSQCCVKIAVVVEESQMEGTWRVQDVPSYLASPNRLFDLHMNQRQLSEETEKRPRIWSGFENPLLSR
ncbi:hypothetical protein M406DRAFT_321782 [Cryphonectria parasitica EP155]|uniref:Uncharacterized protein n=1 Tax=Cryphonectria parasitica (strain ATCC 38755 / EP155) TaxID=660469 RepID=A0A9P4Y6Q0_CRYP1|nr:uncharacterized protein M406DRAFT_321782 [Cryphonectria parasitica EP155]KAF3767932.1 hypothetical protein M406DRAFT_321782 [Cryphonectria parasitica EP155]